MSLQQLLHPLLLHVRHQLPQLFEFHTHTPEIFMGLHLRNRRPVARIKCQQLSQQIYEIFIRVRNYIVEANYLSWFKL